jgi:hypothetical protein
MMIENSLGCCCHSTLLLRHHHHHGSVENFIDANLKDKKINLQINK